ncbi:MAG TPA: glycosyltransferase family 2 protein [Pyrinomonadaceae bacterium]|jgi:glycosyltransferase involved in cell wall biosynthesis|nr:glycosyltransferase family 2 protein [Pyrinomonadaceae bacterium]
MTSKRTLNDSGFASTTPEPEVSVLLVTHNQGGYVRQALDGVAMQQTSFEVEVVLADDYSQDSTPEILREYEAGNPRARLLPTERRLGITRNYKRGFDACRGRYVAVLEGDDFWTSPRKLELLAAFLRRHPECSFCFHRIIRLDEASGQAAVYPAFGAGAEPEFFTARRLARGNFIGNFSACVYRRDIIADLGPGLWSMKVREWPFNIVVARRGLIGYVPEIMSVYRAHPGGVWSQKAPAEQRAALSELIETYNNYLEFEFDAEFQSVRDALTAEARERGEADGAGPAYRRLGRRMKSFVPPVLVSMMNGIKGRGR